MTPHASGAPADAALPEAVGSGSVVDPGGGVSADAALPEAVGSGSVVDSGGGVSADAALPEAVGSGSVVDSGGGVSADAALPEAVGSGSVVDSGGGVSADAALPEAVGSGSVVHSGGGVSADAGRPEAVGSGPVVDSDRGVPVGHPVSPSGVTGRDGDPGADSVGGVGIRIAVMGLRCRRIRRCPRGRGRGRRRLWIGIRWWCCRWACLRTRCGCRCRGGGCGWWVGGVRAGWCRGFHGACAAGVPRGSGCGCGGDAGSGFGAGAGYGARCCRDDAETGRARAAVRGVRCGWFSSQAAGRAWCRGAGRWEWGRGRSGGDLGTGPGCLRWDDGGPG